MSYIVRTKFDGHSIDGTRRLRKGGGGGDQAYYANMDKLYGEQARAAGFMLNQSMPYLPTYMSNSSQMVKEAMDGTLASQMRTQAANDMAGSIQTGIDAANRNAQRYGIGMSQSRLLDESNRNAVLGAAQKAGAMNNATAAAEDMKWNRNAGALGQATGMGTGAMDSMGSAARGYGSAAATVGQNSAMNAAGYGQFGATMAKGLFAADGGYIRAPKLAAGGDAWAAYKDANPVRVRKFKGGSGSPAVMIAAGVAPLAVGKGLRAAWDSDTAKALRNGFGKDDVIDSGTESSLLGRGLDGDTMGRPLGGAERVQDAATESFQNGAVGGGAYLPPDVDTPTPDLVVSDAGDAVQAIPVEDATQQVLESSLFARGGAVKKPGLRLAMGGMARSMRLPSISSMDASSSMRLSPMPAQVKMPKIAAAAPVQQTQQGGPSASDAMRGAEMGNKMADASAEASKNAVADATDSLGTATDGFDAASSGADAAGAGADAAGGAASAVPMGSVIKGVADIANGRDAGTAVADATGAAGGAKLGAMAGSAFGPVGTVVGGALGGLLGGSIFADGGEVKKPGLRMASGGDPYAYAGRPNQNPLGKDFMMGPGAFTMNLMGKDTAEMNSKQKAASLGGDLIGSLIFAKGGTVARGLRQDMEPGGEVDGPGTETSDDIPAWLSDGEYVLNAEAVKMVGKGKLEKINEAGLAKRDGKRLADGGEAKETPEQLLARMAAKYGLAEKPAVAAPAQRPAPVAVEKPAAGLLQGAASALRGRAAQVDKASGYAKGGEVKSGMTAWLKDQAQAVKDSLNVDDPEAMRRFAERNNVAPPVGEATWSKADDKPAGKKEGLRMSSGGFLGGNLGIALGSGARTWNHLTQQDVENQRAVDVAARMQEQMDIAKQEAQARAEERTAAQAKRARNAEIMKIKDPKERYNAYVAENPEAYLGERRWGDESLRGWAGLGQTGKYQDATIDQHVLDRDSRERIARQHSTVETAKTADDKARRDREEIARNQKEIDDIIVNSPVVFDQTDKGPVLNKEKAALFKSYMDSRYNVIPLKMPDGTVKEFTLAQAKSIAPEAVRVALNKAQGGFALNMLAGNTVPAEATTGEPRTTEFSDAGVGLRSKLWNKYVPFTNNQVVDMDDGTVVDYSKIMESPHSQLINAYLQELKASRAAKGASADNGGQPAPVQAPAAAPAQASAKQPAFGVADLRRIAEEEGLGHLLKYAEPIMGNETSGGKNIRRSGDGAMGPMQIIPGTFKLHAKPGESIDNNEHSTRAALRYLNEGYKKFGDDPQRLAAGYFSGWGNVPSGGAKPYINDVADLGGKGTKVSEYVRRFTENSGRSAPAPVAPGSQSADFAKQLAGLRAQADAVRAAQVQAAAAKAAAEQQKQAELNAALRQNLLVPRGLRGVQ